jgi:hypothetical protein
MISTAFMLFLRIQGHAYYTTTGDVDIKSTSTLLKADACGILIAILMPREQISRGEGR